MGGPTYSDPEKNKELEKPEEAEVDVPKPEEKPAEKDPDEGA